jgi:hypothetical protein
VLDDEPAEVDDPGAHYTAFQEPDLICNVYIDAFIQKNLYGATHRVLRHQLKTACRTISSHPDIHVDNIDKMVQSIGTVEQRLGVDMDSIIMTYVLCPACKRRYTLEYIKVAEVDTCMNNGCDGVLFTTQRLASGSQRRAPNTTFPFASPIAWTRHMLSLPGTAELLQTWWCGEHGDNVELAAPISANEWMEGLNKNVPIGDICDGWGW